MLPLAVSVAVSAAVISVALFVHLVFPERSARSSLHGPAPTTRR